MPRLAVDTTQQGSGPYLSLSADRPQGLPPPHILLGEGWDRGRGDFGCPLKPPPSPAARKEISRRLNALLNRTRGRRFGDEMMTGATAVFTSLRGEPDVKVEKKAYGAHT